MSIRGIAGLDRSEIEAEVSRGAVFVRYQYCVSMLVVTFSQPTAVQFVRAGESRLSKGLPYTAVSVLFGWWGIPWGPVHTLAALATNLSGGRDVTQEVLASLP
jgi:hypothetical protein